jgi:hypothetical protein
MTKHKDKVKIFQFKVQLEEINPIIWRRIQVASSYSFWDLHVSIQDAMGWNDSHLHKFRIENPVSKKEEQIGIPEDELDNKIIAGWKESINNWFNLNNKTALYIYDFGDNWIHSIKLEEILPFDENIKYPRCIGGERACPPDDVGGVSGYYEFVEIMKNPSHPTHKEMTEWIDSDNFDPVQFDFRKVKFDNPAKRFKEVFGAS